MAGCVTPGGIRRIRDTTDGALGDVSLQVLNLKAADKSAHFSAMLNDGADKLEAMFSPELSSKLAGGFVKPHAVLKLTDVRYKSEEKRAFVSEFEIVDDCMLTDEYKENAETETPAAKKRKVDGGAAPTSSGKKTQSIASLNPYTGNWTIKAKLASKGAVRTFRNARGEGRVCTIELVDDNGTAIQATMWKDAIDKYDAIMEVGKVYYVSRGSLRPANRQYSNVNNDYEMSLDGKCDISPCEDPCDVSKMSRAYELVAIDALPTKIGTRGSVDVLACVAAVGELRAIRRKSDDSEVQVRDITLLDDTKKTVSLTLWGELATEQGERLANEIGAVVALRGLRVTDYNGVSLSTVQRSELIVEPSGDDIAAKADALRAWYAAEGSTAETTAAGAGLATARGGAGAGAPAQRVDLKAFQPELLPPATNKYEVGILGCATVVLVKPDQPMYYCACPEEGNNKKVVEESPGKWYCEATQKTYDSCRRRYILRLKVSDHAGGGWVNVFHEQACQMLGCDAEELHALRESNPAAYERKVKAAQFKPWGLKLKSKTEEYQGEQKRRLTVLTCAPVDYAAEAKHLLSLIQGTA